MWYSGEVVLFDLSIYILLYLYCYSEAATLTFLASLNLHSTLFILLYSEHTKKEYDKYDLHSTLFILLCRAYKEKLKKLLEFTFYFIYIVIFNLVTAETLE